jgi:urease accessory protein
MFNSRKLLFSIVAFSLLAGQASAHTGEGINSGFACGFWHPILGWDHVVAMVAVGMWGAFLGKPAIWILPIVFPLVMAVDCYTGAVRRMRTRICSAKAVVLLSCKKTAPLD